MTPPNSHTHCQATRASAPTKAFPVPSPTMPEMAVWSLTTGDHSKLKVPSVEEQRYPVPFPDQHGI